MIKWFLRLSFSIILSLLLISIFAFCFYFKYTLERVPLNVPSSNYVLMVTPGMSTQRIAQRLNEDGLLKHPQWFVWWIQISGARLKLKAGEYLIKPGITSQDLIDLLISGKVMQHALTIVEGWKFDQLMAAIQQHPKLSHTLAGLSSEVIMARLGHAGEYPEGLFFPDTYYFPAGTTDVAFLQRAYKRLQNKLMDAWQKRDQSYSSLQTPYDVLVLASIIEKESDFPQEYDEIAGVYHRRLKTRMGLDSDPTVIYGLGAQYSAPLTKKQLAIKTPYNTYMVGGLPPTPIASPSEKALWAATHPKRGDTLYFVAKGDGKGHVFSKTYDEHLIAVARYRKIKQQQVQTVSNISSVKNNETTKKVQDSTN